MEDEERKSGQERGEFAAIKNMTYENRRKLRELQERVDLMKQNILAVEIKLKQQVPAPTTEIEEIRKRLNALEEGWELFMKSIEATIATPSATKKLISAEKKLEAESVTFFAPHSKVSRKKGSSRQKMPQPKEWAKEEEEEVVRDRNEWEEALRGSGMPAVDPGVPQGFDPPGEDYLNALRQLSKPAQERKAREEAERKKQEQEKK